MCQHDLEDIAGEDVLPGRLDRRWRTAAAMSAARQPGARRRARGDRSPARRSAWRPRRRSSPGADCPVVQVVRFTVVVPAGTGHRLHQGHPLAPSVVGGELADNPHDGVRVTELVGQERRASVRPRGRRRSPGSRRGLREGGAARAATGHGNGKARPPWRPGSPGRSGRPRGASPPPTPCPCRSVIVADGRRPMKDQRPHVPACSTDSRMKPGLVPDQAGVSGDGRGHVGQQLAPYRDDRPVAGQGGELVPARVYAATGPGSPVAHYWLCRAGNLVRPETAGRNSCGLPVWQAPRPLARRRTAGCRRRSRSRRPGPTGGRRRCRLCATVLPASRPEDGPAGLEGLAQRRPRSSSAIISTSPVPCSWTMAAPGRRRCK